MSSPFDVSSALDVARRLKEEKRDDRVAWFDPHSKQLEFFSLGTRQRAAFFANRTGKTEMLCAEVSYHLTGEYPAFWPDRAPRFSTANDWVIVGKTGQTLRDIMQTRLLGKPGMPSDLGTGMIPKRCVIAETKTAMAGVPHGIESICIQHKSGGVSRLYFRSGQQGAALFEGLTISGGIAFDEEPSENPRETQLIFDEALMRVVATKWVSTPAVIIVGFTPILGRTPLVKRFMDEVSPDRAYVTASIDDAPHIPVSERERMKRECLPHLYKARILGIPGQGESSVWAGVDVDGLKWEAPALSDLPRHWVFMWAIDFGIRDSFAAVLGGLDRDAQTLHILKAIKVRDMVPLQHCDLIRRIAPSVPIAYPVDGDSREKGSGKALIDIYRDHALGLDFLSSPVNVGDARAVEPGILRMREMMLSGRYRVNKELEAWFSEARSYERDPDTGVIIGRDDHLMDASRYLLLGIERKGAQDTLGNLSRRDRAILANRREEMARQFAAGGRYDPDTWGCD